MSDEEPGPDPRQLNDDCLGRRRKSLDNFAIRRDYAAGSLLERQEHGPAVVRVWRCLRIDDLDGPLDVSALCCLVAEKRDDAAALALLMEQTVHLRCTGAGLTCGPFQYVVELAHRRHKFSSINLLWGRDRSRGRL